VNAIGRGIQDIDSEIRDTISGIRDKGVSRHLSGIAPNPDLPDSRFRQFFGSAGTSPLLLHFLPFPRKIICPPPWIPLESLDTGLRTAMRPGLFDNLVRYLIQSG
jgi:hypothetical protein